MDKITFYAPEEHKNMLVDLRKIPFAKTDDGYRFAYWVYDLNDTEEKRTALMESNNGEEAMKLLEKAKADLESILVSEDDYLSWTVHKKEAGGIAQYHSVLHELAISLVMLSISTMTKAEDIVGQFHRDEAFYFTKSQNNADPDNTKKIMNRHNPFADVTIKSQQFFFKTVDGSTETLFFNTNDIVEKVDKNGRDMLTMRPSFSVTKEHGVARNPMQKVTFANSITEPIVGDEDHIYIHID